MAEVEFYFVENIKRSSIMFNRMLKNKQSKMMAIGVGGGGNNILNFLADSEIENISLIACDLDATVLNRSKSSAILQIGNDGLGAGNMVEKAKIVVEDDIGAIKKRLGNDSSISVVISTLGGGCGSGVAPIVAREAKKLGKITIGIATLPFQFEGERKMNQSLDALRVFVKEVDAIFVLNNQCIIQQCGELPIDEAFSNANKMMCNVIKSIVQSMTNTETGQEIKKMSIFKKIIRKICGNNVTL